MADIIPSPSFTDPGWVPEYEHLNPEQRLDILSKSIKLERGFLRFLASLDGKYDEFQLGKGKRDDFEWVLKYERSDGNIRLKYSYRYKYKNSPWRSISASPVVFIRSLVSGQWESFKRFELDADFDYWTITGAAIRVDIGNVLQRIIRAAK
jgi:hypothetical protein